MIAIYARQSVDRADSISIEQQTELCRYETRGEAYRVYTDRGYSGKNTNRPGFTQMTDDIKKGDISTVIVYKLDRISRSILDFSNMMEMFSKYRVQFISATEKFDTSSPMGNAMLNICIVFAQLERETIQKRVADAYGSRCRKSLYMGGPVPYGFRKIPAVIDGIHTSMYEAVPEEAEVVNMIYSMYAQPFTSCGDILRHLNELGLKKRRTAWARPRIRDILINPIYVKADISIYDFFMSHGADVVNPPSDFNGENGCYSYKGRSQKKKASSAVTGNQIVIAPHKGIVNPYLWLKCREKFMGQKPYTPSQKAKNSWLSGKIKCGKCGYALISRNNSSHSRRFLMCSKKLNYASCSGAGTLHTDETEQIVERAIRKKLKQFPTLSPAHDNSRKAEIEAGIAEANRKIQCLLDKVNDSDSTLLHYINERITSLDRHKAELEKRMSDLDGQYGTSADATDCHHTVWDELSFDDKRQVADILIQVIYASSERITILWRI